MGSLRHHPAFTGILGGAVFGCAAVSCFAARSLAGPDGAPAAAQAGQNRRQGGNMSDIVGRLNRLFFVAGGVSMKLQLLLGQIVPPYMDEPPETFTELYAADPDRVEHFFYYHDRVTEAEALWQEITAAYDAASGCISAAEEELKKAGMNPVKIALRIPEHPAAFEDSADCAMPSGSATDEICTADVVRLCDATQNFCQDLMAGLDALIEQLEHGGQTEQGWQTE